MSNFEYSDWIEHDGLGIPVLSETFVLVQMQDDREDGETPEVFEQDIKLGNQFGLIVDSYKAKFWGPHWNSTHSNPIIRYRVITELT